MIAVDSFNTHYFSKFFIKDNHLMWNEAVLSDQSQEKIRLITTDPSLVNDHNETIVTKLCTYEVLTGGYCVRDVCDYITCPDVKDSAIFSHHKQLIIHFIIWIAV